jgi:hypothetical protein
MKKRQISEKSFNMKRLLASSVLVLVVLLVVPGAVLAQDFRNMELNGYVLGGVFNTSNFLIVFPQAIVPIQEQFKLNNGLGGGVRFNVNTTRHWGEELFFSYQPNKAHFTRNTPPTQTQSYGIRLYNFGVNALYYLNEEESRHTRPFLSAGIGGTVEQPTAKAVQFANDPLLGDLPGFETSASFAFNYGVGVKQILNDYFSLRGDLRGFLSRNPSFGLPRTSSNPNAVVFPASGSLNNFELSVGIIYRFNR